MNKDDLKAQTPTSSLPIGNTHVVRSPLWEDVAHLYLGCQVIGTYNGASGSRGYLTGITNGGTECEIQFILEDGFNVSEEPEFNDIKEVKPILLQLDDMTEKDAQDIWHKSTGSLYERNNKPRVINSTHSISKIAPLMKELLSQHFDLFGLIENGIALDASKLNVVSER